MQRGESRTSDDYPGCNFTQDWQVYSDSLCIFSDSSGNQKVGATPSGFCIRVDECARPFRFADNLFLLRIQVKQWSESPVLHPQQDEHRLLIHLGIVKAVFRFLLAEYFLLQ